ncbi:MAG: hypothetical protein IJL41_03345 [Clostridia bacterium]|nr:hypothetical protein [Clostridia bacterium]
MSETLDRTALLTPDLVSPAAVAFDGERFYTVNGSDPFAFVFARDGTFLNKCRTVRPYRTARYDAQTRTFCCLGSGCGRTVYFTDERFAETGCARIGNAPHGDGGYIADAFTGENGELLNVVRPKALEVYSSGGDYLLTSARADEGTEYLLWARGESGSALCFEQNGVRFIETADETRVMESCVKLRSFVPYGNAVLGAFSDNYIYTYVSPLFDPKRARAGYAFPRRKCGNV